MTSRSKIPIQISTDRFSDQHPHPHTCTCAAAACSLPADHDLCSPTAAYVNTMNALSTLLSAVAIALVVCAGIVHQTRVLSTFQLAYRPPTTSMQQTHGQKTVTVGNMTLHVSNSITPEYPPIIPLPPKPKVRREKRETTNRRKNIQPSKSASVRRPPVTNSTRKIMYVHVGKTGGTTLDTVFRSNCAWYGLTEPRRRCYANFNNRNTSLDSVLSYLTKSTIHIRPRVHYKRWINETTTFLFSVRNPIARAVSAFDMDHIQNNNNNMTDQPKMRNARAPLYECFPTAEHLAQGLYGNSRNGTMDVKEQEQCRTTAWMVLTGNQTSQQAKVVTHLYHNYAYYKNLTLDQFPNREVMVVRTESLWQDISRLDVFLGGTGQFLTSGHRFDHGRATQYRVKSRLTPQGKQYFCKALQDEIAIYRMLIERAVNLNATEKRQSIGAVQADCGEEWKN